MCMGSNPAMPPPVLLPPMPGPVPTALDPAVVRAGDDMKRKAQAAAGYASTITNSGGGSGLAGPALVAGAPGFKTLTGQ
jgi:hypothetical protein